MCKAAKAQTWSDRTSAVERSDRRVWQYCGAFILSSLSGRFHQSRHRSSSTDL